jgi:hypothetical protein
MSIIFFLKPHYPGPHGGAYRPDPAVDWEERCRRRDEREERKRKRKRKKCYDIKPGKTSSTLDAVAVPAAPYDYSGLYKTRRALEELREIRKDEEKKAAVRKRKKRTNEIMMLLRLLGEL